MKKTEYIAFCLLLLLAISCSDNISPRNDTLRVITIDTVYSFYPGEGQNAGQDSQYYPKNIFGLPGNNLDETIPFNSPEQILSLGLGGEITVGFKNYKIINGDGDDFIVFENVFLNPINGKYFIEPAEVSVSKDGINFIKFPYDTINFIGCAGLHPTLWNSRNIQNSGGDKFDLNSIGLDYITHIKIRDISREILQNPKNPYYDPIISGFDLDAVIGINYERLQ
ncbi:hypothetical protein D9V86_12510 [Bacteroidetes/Chlorobi group bacterium ChocPot_Mid]|nr:MAG: hypothetical protein D9V86_12510 [Bacteroidetes/Chlorobi group bacterium ChocPot_Mid]